LFLSRRTTKLTGRWPATFNLRFLAQPPLRLSDLLCLLFRQPISDFSRPCGGVQRMVLFDYSEEPRLTEFFKQLLDSNPVVLSVVRLILEATIYTHSVQHHACCPQFPFSVLSVPDHRQYLFGRNRLLRHINV